jgi:hypothetical protein
MKRSRNRFAWLGILLVALLLSLGVTGVGYALWTDAVDIHGIVEPGCIGVALSEGQGVPSGNVTGAIAGHTISIEIDAGAAGDYAYAGFDIHNIGTIPVKIQSIQIACPPGAEPVLTGVAVGTQIDQNGVGSDTVYGTVTVTVPAAGIYNCQVTFAFVQWNL